MRGKKNFNFPAFMKAAEELRRKGHEVFNPAEADINRHGSFKKVKDALKKDRATVVRNCLSEDLNWILDHAECIAILPNWQKSKGVKAELALAKALGLEIRFLRS